MHICSPYLYPVLFYCLFVFTCYLWATVITWQLWFEMSLLLAWEKKALKPFTFYSLDIVYFESGIRGFKFASLSVFTLS